MTMIIERLGGSADHESDQQFFRPERLRTLGAAVLTGDVVETAVSDPRLVARNIQYRLGPENVLG